jgi:serine protease
MKAMYRFAAVAFTAVMVACGKPSEEAVPAPDSASQAPAAPAATPAAIGPDFKAATQPVANDEAGVEKQQAERKQTFEKLRAQWQGKTFEAFAASVYKEPFQDGKYIVSGDIAVADEKHLRELFERNIQGTDDAAAEGDERLIVVAGANGTWNAGRKKELTYCVSKDFGERYPRVIEDMRAAAAAWESVADVKFKHVDQQDTTCTANNTAVLFDVRPYDSGGRYLARAFFPNERRATSNVLIDPSSFARPSNDNLQLLGILRHELGHTLGWRHEHTRPEAGVCFEDDDWVPMTNYDHLSVMHYPQCNGGADWKLLLTDRDKSGAACVYGSAPGFTINRKLVPFQCAAPIASPAAPGTPKTQTFLAQKVARDAVLAYGPFEAKPGTIVVASITTTGSNRGDADLYVNLGRAPEIDDREYVCRPFLTSSEETCEVTASTSPKNRVHIGVKGYSAAEYDVKVVYFPK